MLKKRKQKARKRDGFQQELGQEKGGREGAGAVGGALSSSDALEHMEDFQGAQLMEESNNKTLMLLFFGACILLAVLMLWSPQLSQASRKRGEAASKQV